MRQTPEVSVIVPCYKQAIFLDECISSVIGQTFRNWECIIVDDGSPDNTEEIAKEWCNKDPRIKYCKKSNEGVSIARNYGIGLAVGKYILPLDGACPKNCVNDQEMVEIPEEKVWSWHERNQNQKRILSTKSWTASTSGV